MGLKVIIVGGSISGLSLANMLERLEIDYVLLEGHAIIAPQLGASLGLLPSGLRILDQLGCYEKIHGLAGNTFYKAHMRLFGGGWWEDQKSVSFSEKLEERIGYPQIFIDRRTVIQVLFDKLKFKDRVHTSKRVTRVEHGENDVTVFTKDGFSYTGDFVIGSDGIHSTVRHEMWRIANDEQPGLFQSDPISDLRCESKCIFGISQMPKTLPAAPLQLNAFFKDCNYMILSAPEDRLYWFLFTTADKVYGKDIPRYSKEDERALAEQHFQDRVTDTTTFEDIYTNKLQTTLVSIEDHVFPRWHYRRILTIGDAAHKLHPISAQGGNGALETSAVLTNTLATLLRSKPHTHALKSDPSLSDSDIESLFTTVQSKRFQRAIDAVNQGRHTNNASIKETPLNRVFVNWFFPRWGQALIFSLIIKNTLSGPVVEDLPLPKRHADAMERHESPQAGRNWMLWGFLLSGAGVLGMYTAMFSNYRVV